MNPAVLAGVWRYVCLIYTSLARTLSFMRVVSALVVLLNLNVPVGLSIMIDPDGSAVTLINNLTSTAATSSLSAFSVSEVPQDVMRTVPSQSKVNT